MSQITAYILWYRRHRLFTTLFGTDDPYMALNTKRKYREVHSDEDDDSTDSSGKRVKLDSMFLSLSLGEDNDDSTDRGAGKKNLNYEINPTITAKYGGIQKRSSTPHISSRTFLINSFLNEKLNEHLNELFIQSLGLISWYDYRFLIVYWYQKWFVKLFNRFVKKYNQRNGTSIERFKTYDKILQLVRDGLLSNIDLFNIIRQENHLEIQRLQVKQEKRQRRKDSEKWKLEQEVYKDLQYTYWDTLKIDPDFEMTNMSPPKVVELEDDYDSDVDMQVSD